MIGSSDSRDPIAAAKSEILLHSHLYQSAITVDADSRFHNLTIGNHSFYSKDIKNAPDSSLLNEYRSRLSRLAFAGCVDAIGASLDRLILVHHETSNNESDQRDYRKASHGGLNRKFDYWKNYLGLDQTWIEIWEGYNLARNCIAHRSGFVTASDCNLSSNFLRLSWVDFNIRRNSMAFGRPVYNRTDLDLSKFITLKQKDYLDSQASPLPICMATNFEAADRICFCSGTLMSIFWTLFMMVELAGHSFDHQKS